MKRRIITIVFLIISIGMTYCQKAPTYRWLCDSGMSVLNGHAAAMVGGGDSIVLAEVPLGRCHTMMIAYQVGGDGAEVPLWRLGEGGRAFGVTTQGIVSYGTKVSYSAGGMTDPIVNTLTQGVSQRRGMADSATLTLGGEGVAGGCAKVSELMYFDGDMDEMSIRIAESYMAIRGGITLKCSDYISGRGDTVWHHGWHKRHIERVTGLGKDSLYGLNQRSSRSECAGAAAEICADSLAEGDYLMAGDDGGTMTFDIQPDGSEILGRTWMLEGTVGAGTQGGRKRVFNLTLTTAEMEGSVDSLVAILGQGRHFPDARGEGWVRFEGLPWPSDTATLQIGRGRSLWDAEESEGKAGLGMDGESRVTAEVSPNPSRGHYVVRVAGAKEAHVQIYDMRGLQMAGYADRGKEIYIYEGSLPRDNTYLVTVETEQGKQTTKLVVM